MILQALHIDGFGKLSNLDLQFSDGTNVIYGDNEAGKSTLCRFIFHMLYGMERSRGKASRFDAYVRYLPWQSAAYGGSLTFEAENTLWFLERSFLTDSRFIRLTNLEDSTIFSDADASSTLFRLLGGVNEAAYLSMYLISQQSCTDITALSYHLKQYTQNLPGSGSVSISPSQAVKDLKRQKKELSSQLSGISVGELYRTEEELNTVQRKLLFLADEHPLTSEFFSTDEYLLTDEQTDGDIPTAETTCLDLGSGYSSSPDFSCSGSTRRHLPRIFGILLIVLSAVFFLYSVLSGTETDSYTHLIPTALCFITGLFVLLLSLRRNHTDKQTSAPSSLKNIEFSGNHYISADLTSDHKLAAEIYILQNQEENLLRQKAELEQKLTSDKKIRQNMEAVQLAIDTITELSAEIHHTYSADLQRTFARYASTLTGRPFSQILIDESFRFTLMEGNRLVPLDALSRGTVTQLFLSCRLASIHLLYPKAALPLMLDDVFSLTDDTRLSVLLTRLSSDFSGQKLIFSCQKREAAILSQHSLSYHLIQL